MRNYLFILITILICGSCTEEPRLARLPKGAVILAFGDSLTYGTGAMTEESYPAVLEELSGLVVINAGISGEESAEGLARLPDLLEEHRPQLLILCHGGNDIMRKRDAGKMETNLRNMIRLARSENIPVVMLGVPKPGLFLSAAEVYKNIAESTEVVYIEEVIPMVLSDKALKSDTVHPNKRGYRVMAQEIHARLQAAGAL